ncbi:unnamed protein product [Sphenostylis stenocarpa]|uniref:Uncharacterized protein n=1 Tax=Sphenostylis stenocarpa TaxID=92480 RepID=A0AA86SFP1_9FABA|nr:unnamed protein product [Sphenostylis stenocarpa]
MASRAILRRRRSFIDQYVNNVFSSSSTSYVRSLERAIATTTPPIPCKHGRTPHRDLCDRFGLGKFGSAVPHERYSGFNAPIGVRWLTQSAAAAKNHDQEKNDEAVAKKRKEASPEECDQAVEGLTTAKAKAMAKRSQESQKEVQSVLRRVWTAFLGIGPALRAVASMSRSAFIVP